MGYNGTSNAIINHGSRMHEYFLLMWYERITKLLILNSAGARQSLICLIFMQAY